MPKKQQELGRACWQRDPNVQKPGDQRGPLLAPALAPGPRGTRLAWGGRPTQQGQLIPGLITGLPLAPCRQAPSLRMAWM